MRSEFLPATEHARQSLVLLHGWGTTREVWRPLLSSIRPWADVTLLELPGCSPVESRRCVLDEVIESLLRCCPPCAVYVGWSLGGQIATLMAIRDPLRVAALVTVCSNPCFTKRCDWPGIPKAELDQLRDGLQQDPVRALNRFDALQVDGCARSRALLKELRRQRQGCAAEALEVGLGWLEALDLRSVLQGLKRPQLHLLGDADSLVPDGLERALQAWLADRPQVSVRQVPALGHVAPLENPELLADEVLAFIQQAGLLASAPPSTLELDKREVAASFSRAAGAYDSAAHLQHDVGAALLRRLSEHQEPVTVLDLGCGTGFFAAPLRSRYPNCRYIGLDIAAGMISYARGQMGSGSEWLVGDAEALPLAAESVDLVFSSLALQWCQRPELVLAELARVLKPGGKCVFTSLGPETLIELREAWASADTRQHVNRFLPVQALTDSAAGITGIELELAVETITLSYERVRDLLGELKAIGAHNMNQGRPAGLTGRRALQAMLSAYETRRSNGLLPATYEVIYGSLSKR
ncbi:MAG: malonyl-ACP O-methyltransferase BioC [Pseudomonadota bacterium]